MAEIGSPGTRTRGIENIIDAPSFSLGFTQQENPIAGGSSYAEMRSKKINDPRRNKQHHDSHDDKETKRKQSAPDKKVSQVPLQKKRKVAKNVPGAKGKKVVLKKPSIDVEDAGEVFSPFSSMYFNSPDLYFPYIYVYFFSYFL